jgi:peptidylprolyl isomerase
MRRFVPLALSACLLVPLAACCSDDTGPGAGATSSPAETGAGGLDAVTVSGSFGDEPTVEFDQPFTVAETTRRVLEEGDGDAVEEGMTVVMDYVMVNGRDGAAFDSSYDADPASIAMDPSQIIPGLVEGVVGAKVGSRVLVAIPPDAGFGLMGGVADAGVGADDTVLAVIDVLEARVPLERASGKAVTPAPGLPTVTLDEDGAPTIGLPDTAAPAELVVQPLITGEGAAVESGQSISVHYTGVVWPGGEEFDSSWGRGPATFQIGTGRVIAGWDKGLVGQPIGSQVLLVVPPGDGYGPEGNAQAGIEGTDTLVFVVDILDAS